MKEQIQKEKKSMLVIFDADGVLLDNKLGGFKDMLVVLSKKDEVKAIDDEYQKRKSAGPWGLEHLAKLYKGFSKENLEKTASEYCRANLMEGAKEAVREIKKKGYYVGALSSNPQFLMESLREILSLDFAKGTELEFKDGMASGRILQKVDRYMKAEILKEEMKNLGLNKEQVIVVGDSLTDLPMAREAGKFIAFNARKETKKEADAIIEEKDLRKITKFVGGNNYGKSR